MLIAKGQIKINASLEKVYDFLMNIENFPSYEEKVTTLDFLDPETKNLLQISGHYGPFAYKASCKVTRWPGKGYQSELVEGPLKHARGVFLTKQVEDGTELTHIEEYDFHPPFGWLLNRALQPYVQATVMRELAEVKRQVEALLP